MSRKPDPWLPTRHTLLVRLKDKSDDQSWQEFFDLYGRLIYSVAMQAGLSHVEAQEVVQETILYVTKKIEHFQADPSVGSFKAWLRQLIQWRIRDQVRKRRPDEVHRVHRHSQNSADSMSPTATEEHIPDSDSWSFEALWDQEWMAQVKNRALEILRSTVNPKRYQIFQMHVLEGHSVKDVAAAFAVAEAQIHLIKHRLLKTLKDESEKLQQQLK